MLLRSTTSRAHRRNTEYMSIYYKYTYIYIYIYSVCVCVRVIAILWLKKNCINNNMQWKFVIPDRADYLNITRISVGGLYGLLFSARWRYLQTAWVYYKTELRRHHVTWPARTWRRYRDRPTIYSLTHRSHWTCCCLTTTGTERSRRVDWTADISSRH